MYLNLTALIMFVFVAAFTPGPNNLLASYSGFNFGIKKSLPLIYGVTFGFPLLFIVVNFGLAIIFEKFPKLQDILKILGSVFLIYMAYKIATTSKSENKEIKNPAKFFNMLIFQFINPKAVIIAVIMVSTFISQGENFLLDSIVVVSVAIILSFLSITSWCLLGKFISFGKNEKFLSTLPSILSTPLRIFSGIFNYFMSILLVLTVIMFWV